MATLQAAKPVTSPGPRARLKQLTGGRLFAAPARPQITGGEKLEALPASTGNAAAAAANPARPYHGRLTEVEQRQLLIQTVSIYPGWELVSIQHRPENDMLIAYLVPATESEDAALAIREGRAMQIMMDASGDLRIKRARRVRGNVIVRFLHWLVNKLSGSVFTIAA